MKEADIRPRHLFDAYLRLLEEDIETFFGDHAGFEEVRCPGCGASESRTALVKSGFTYRECPACASLWTSPRPPAARLAAFYQSGKAAEYWCTSFYRETAEARRAHIFRPRAALLQELLARPGAPRPDTVADIGAGYGLFLEETAALGTFRHVVGIEPNPGLARVCRDRGFRVLEKTVEDVQAGELAADAVTAFEVLEHVHDPQQFLCAVRRILAPGGWLVLTTLTASGFDIQTLWERSNAVTPPQHLNLLSVEGMRQLMTRAGLEIVELTTPGRLDVDIVANALAREPGLPLPRFVAYMLAQRDAATREQFQAFLQSALLSSHVRVIARPA
jgi:SAM-dependent methyltransferase